MWSRAGWRGIALVAITYVYFLIFAQFAFLSRIGEAGVEGASLKVVMGAMALGGILLSLLTPRVLQKIAPVMRLRVAFAVSGAAAVLSLLPLSVATAAVVAFLIGAGLGLLTVTLVTHLRLWTGERHGVLKAGLGTGLGYFVCNVPAVFTASPAHQAALAAVLCVVGIAMTFGARNVEVEVGWEYPSGAKAPASRQLFGTTEVVPLHTLEHEQMDGAAYSPAAASGDAMEGRPFHRLVHDQTDAVARAHLTAGGETNRGAFFHPSNSEGDLEAGSKKSGGEVSFPRALVSFAALVWLDSAAFYVIQHVPELKAGTWMGSAHLWTNGGLHLSAAIIAGFLLERRRVNWVLAGAVGALAFACVLLAHPALVLSASLFYPVGVSLYSVALVAYPSFLSDARTHAERGRQAGWLYAIAGWVGSAMGIGMGQNLGHVPLAFALAAATVVLLPAVPGLALARGREFAVMSVAFGAAYLLGRALPESSSRNPSGPVARGRQVYISEGCIHCHSQYVRPHTPDVLMWGPTETLEELHAQRPPLIGNRRQGPDLAEVGARRSPLWLKAHLMDPAEVSGGSIMPSFAFLFQDQRGNDLVAYLASLHGDDAQKHIEAAAHWQLPPSEFDHAKPEEGRRLYARFCATCHDAHGATRERWASSFKDVPTNLSSGPFKYVPVTESRAARLERMARITKFGIPQTDMPGHEYLSNEQVASLSLWLAQQAPPATHGF